LKTRFIQRLLSYAFGAASLTSGTYQNATALDFTALVNNTSADAAKDGNNASFRTAGKMPSWKNFLRGTYRKGKDPRSIPGKLHSDAHQQKTLLRQCS